MLLPTATAYPAPSDLSLISISQIIKNPSQQARIVGLSVDDAQCVADFLSQLIYEDDALSSDNRKCLLTLLQKLVNSAQVLPQCYKLQEVQCDFSQAREGGSFADIFQGQYGEQKVCVKAVRIFQKADNARMLKALAKEIVIWAHLSHENILPFYGISEGVSGRICIISPWIDPGDLSVYLQNFPHRPRLPLVGDITAGLQYLHQSDIVHGDLKAKNILVSDDGRALIADFGISRIVVSTKLASTQVSSGTMRWMAPELLIDDEENCPTVTLKSDIWSLGCVYYEIFTRKVPFYHCANDARLAMIRLDPMAIPERPADGSAEDNISDDMWWLMKRCWDSEPCSRPNSNDIHALVTDLLGVREQRWSHKAALWKVVGGGLEIGPTSERARCILFQICHADYVGHSTVSAETIRSDPSAVWGSGSTFTSAFSSPFSFGPKKKSREIYSTTSESRSCDLLEEIRDVKVEQIKESDILIALMGPTKSGKSSFVSAITGEYKGIGHSLTSYTSGVHAVRVRVPESDASIVLVDTPGFDDTHKSDHENLKIISEWLKKAGSKNLILNRVLYFHRISDNRMAGTVLKNLELFERICGPRWFNRVVLVTTMWDELDDQEVGIARERELRDTFWKPMIDRGSTTQRHDGAEDSAWGIIHNVLETRKQQQLKKGKSLPNTNAGYELYAQMDDLDKKRKGVMQTLQRQMARSGVDDELKDMLRAQYNELEQSQKETKDDLSKLKATASQRFFKSLGMKTRYFGMS